MKFKAKIINDKVDGPCDKKILSERAVWKAKLAARVKTVRPSGAKGKDLDIEV